MKGKSKKKEKRKERKKKEKREMGKVFIIKFVWWLGKKFSSSLVIFSWGTCFHDRQHSLPCLLRN